MEALFNLEKVVDKEIDKLAQKGELSPAELETVTKAVCLKEKIQHYKHDEMMFSQGNSGYYRPMMDNSYARGRDIYTGQYTSRDGRSYGNDSWLISKMENLRNEAPNEYDRQAIDRYMSGMMR